MAGLLYLKQACDLPDEEVCMRWLENPYWRRFTGEAVFQTLLPCNPNELPHWRHRLAKAGVEELPVQTTEVWYDSPASGDTAQKRCRRRSRSVSFRVNAKARMGAQERSPFELVYRGRYTHFKYVPEAVGTCDRVLVNRPDARLFIYGHEGPATAAVTGKRLRLSAPAKTRRAGVIDCSADHSIAYCSLLQRAGLRSGEGSDG